MWRYRPFLIAVLGVFLFGGLAGISAAEADDRTVRLASLAPEPVPAMTYVAGEIAWVDVKLGKLQLREEGLRGSLSETEYRINQQATNVTDPSDKKFLTLNDLRSGQYIAIESEQVNSRGERMARKITVESTPESAFQQMAGIVEAIDANAGTLVLNQRSPDAENASGNLAYFIFEPQDIVVMQSPSREPVRLVVKPGDPVMVEYMMKDGRRRAYSVTLYSEGTEWSGRRTTTTTTTSVTTTR